MKRQEVTSRGGAESGGRATRGDNKRADPGGWRERDVTTSRDAAESVLI